ncbi:MAG TPA: response regulator, partial [Phycisphaerae bacterium]|nr:response regulator [Phycisphaerae bacterium]
SAALHEAGKGEFDLLISDLGLPDGSGVELLQNVRAGGNDLPAIALTGYGQDEDIRRTREAGFRTHLTKPIDFDQLQRAVTETAVAAG